MRGPSPQYPIQLVENEIKSLQALINARKSGQGKVRRAKIILYAHQHPEWSNQDIAREIGCSTGLRKFVPNFHRDATLENLERTYAKLYLV